VKSNRRVAVAGQGLLETRTEAGERLVVAAQAREHRFEAGIAVFEEREAAAGLVRVVFADRVAEGQAAFA
jgi:hypothetical protein